MRVETLLPEERAALNEDDMMPEEKAALEALIEGKGVDDARIEEGEAVEATPPTETVVTHEALDTNEAAPVSTEHVNETPLTPQAPIAAPLYRIDLPPDFQAQVEAVKTDKVALLNRYKNGDMESDAYEEALDALREREQVLKEQRLKADLANELSEQAAKQQFATEILSFVEKTKREDGIDYATDVKKQRAFDAFLTALGADPDHANKPNAWFFAEAHTRTTLLFGLNDKTPPEKAAAPLKANTERKAPLAPVTLAQVQGSDGAEIASEFADIDRLDGLALERALAKMTPEQRVRYEQGL